MSEVLEVEEPQEARRGAAKKLSHLRVCAVCLVEFCGGHSAAYCGDCKPVVKKIIRNALSEAQKAQYGLDPKNFLCVDCAEPAVCFDHRDYSKPHELAAVCKSCNKRRGPADWSWLRKQKEAA